MIVCETEPHRYLPDAGVWWDVAPAEVSALPEVQERRAEYERDRDDAAALPLLRSGVRATRGRARPRPEAVTTRSAGNSSRAASRSRAPSCSPSSRAR